MKKTLLLFFILSVFRPLAVNAQNDTFTCDGSYYFATDASGVSVTDLQLVVITQFVSFQPFVIYNAVINSVGFNRKDNLIYGLETSQNQIIRMFKNGVYQLMGNPNLPSPGAYVSGDVDSGGIFTLVGGNPPYAVFYDVTGPTATQLGSVQLYYTNGFSGNPTFYDVAYHPYTGVLYGYDYNGNSRRLCTIDIVTGAVDPYGAYEPNAGSGALFFDVYGQLYSYMNGKMYRFDIATGAATLVAIGPATGRQDGCSCPYTIKLGKSSLPSAICPGDTFTLRYEIRNVLNDTLKNINLFDQLPFQFQILHINTLKDGIITPGTGVGTNVLSIDNMILPPDTNVINVLVASDPAMFGGFSLGSQGSLSNLPAFFRDTIYSDDPATVQIDDTTFTVIYPKEDNRNLIANVPPLCVGDNLTLNAAGPLNTTYHWTGPDSFESFQAVNVLIDIPPAAFGTYYVYAVQNGCTVMRDSVTVKKDDCANEYPCISNFYLSRFSPGDSSRIALIDFTSTMTLDTISIHRDSLDATGYRVADHFIYAFDNGSRKVIRLFATGKGSVMDIDGNLPPGPYEAGSVDTAGNYVITGSSGVIVRMDVRSRKALILSSAPLKYLAGGSGQAQFGDIAFDPWTNVCYGYDENTGKLSQIDPLTGNVVAFGYPLTDVDIQSLFFNSFGELFGYGKGVYYRIFTQNGLMAATDTSLFTLFEDGSSCPYKVEMQKIFEPGAICPGEEFRVIFKIANRSGAPMTGVGFFDKLHQKMTITSVDHYPGGTINPGSGVGSNQIFIYNMTLPAGIDSVVLKVRLSGQIKGDKYLDNQAILVNVQGEEDTIYSDWPVSLRFNDPSYLYLYPTPVTYQKIDLCDGEQYFAGGQWQTNNGIYTDSLQTTHGCDSVVNTELIFHPNKSATFQAFICNGDSIYAGGAWQKSSGTYRDSFLTLSGCDSIIITEVTVSNVTIVPVSHEICEGDSIYLVNAWRKSPGTFYDTIPTSGACDSVFMHTLIVHPVRATDVEVQICEGSSYYAGGAFQTSSGLYIDHYSTRFGCDSTVRTNLLVLKKVINTIQAEICESENYPFGNQMLNQSGTYTDTFLLPSGCDSIVVLNLLVHPEYRINQSLFICTGDSVFFNGKWIKSTGTYTDSAQTTKGCDSLSTLELTVGSVQVSTIDTAICEGAVFYFDNRVLQNAGTYYDTLSGSSGCDSVLQLNLSIWPNPLPDLGPDTMICAGQPYALDPGEYKTYLWQNGSNEPQFQVTASGKYAVTVSDEHGCRGRDSVEIEVRIPPYINFGPDLYRCPGFEIILDVLNANADVFRWSTGDTGRILRIREAGQYWLIASNGCESSDTIHIFEYDTMQVRLPRDTVICRNDELQIEARAIPGSTFRWNTGEEKKAISIFEAGTYRVSATDPNGCTSQDSFHLEKFDCVEQLAVPSAFSPNGDGANDRFHVESEEYEIFEAHIFDRWGNEVFRSQGPTVDWDGTLEGNNMPAGVYVIYIRFRTRDAREHLFHGNLTLLR